MAELNDLLIRQLDMAFNRRSWHGTNLMGSLRGLAGEILTWRPQPERHNIAELAVHTAYWKYRAHRLLPGADAGAFEFGGSNFFPRESPLDAAAWKRDLEVMADRHRRFCQEVARLTRAELRQPSRNNLALAEVIAGVAAHDLYHAGQIQLIKTLHANRTEG